MKKLIYLFACVLSTAAACHFLVLMAGDNKSLIAGAACVFFATMAVVFSHGHMTQKTIQTKHRNERALKFNSFNKDGIIAKYHKDL